MFETILYTIMIGMIYFIIFGSIALWVLNYLIEQFEEMAKLGLSFGEIVIMLGVFFIIGAMFA